MPGMLPQLAIGLAEAAAAGRAVAGPAAAALPHPAASSAARAGRGDRRVAPERTAHRLSVGI